MERWTDPRGTHTRVFAGMTTAEIAAALSVSTRTVEMDWQMARRWLAQRLAAQDGGGAGD